MGIKLLLLGLERSPDIVALSEAPGYARTLCMSNTFIPLFWLLAFRRADVHMQAVEGPARYYPVLYAERKTLLQNLDECVQPLSELLGRSTLPLLRQWVGYIARLDVPVLMLETWELWRGFADQQGLLTQLQDQLEALERLVATGHLSDELRAGLLEPANLLLPGCNSLCLDDISLTGYGWRAH
ncbi:MAG: hypothetical protein OIF57_19875 [Marinobacterium sp.]|nr:hypothetical protein [Marinobacterium sp.]